MGDTVEKSNKFFKSTLIFKIFEGYKYSTKISGTKTTAVNFLKGKNWFIRFDNPHKNVPFSHINLRHSITGIKDPHLKIPAGTISVAKGGAYVAKCLDWLCYTALLIDGAQLANSAINDYRKGTTQETLECAKTKSGQYLGGIAGCVIGKTIGGFLIPGFGPLIGGFGLGVVGVVYGNDLTRKGFNYIKNTYNEKNK